MAAAQRQGVGVEVVQGKLVRPAALTWRMRSSTRACWRRRSSRPASCPGTGTRTGPLRDRGVPLVRDCMTLLATAYFHPRNRGDILHLRGAFPLNTDMSSLLRIGPSLEDPPSDLLHGLSASS